MPRSYYKNYRKNYSSNKKKWASFMKEIPKTIVQMVPGTAGSFATIVANSNEGATPTPTILKVKHLRVAADLYIETTNLNGGFVCLMYLPQGTVPGANTALLHPEWVLCWKGIQVNSATGHNLVQFSSSLSRNLNSGDSIVLYFSFFNPLEQNIPITFEARCSCVVRNN